MPYNTVDSKEAECERGKGAVSFCAQLASQGQNMSVDFGSDLARVCRMDKQTEPYRTSPFQLLNRIV
jgi:hypothetical protein